MAVVSAAEVVVRLSAAEAEVIAPEVVALAGDRGRSLTERAAWLAVGAQLLRQLLGAP